MNPVFRGILKVIGILVLLVLVWIVLLLVVNQFGGRLNEVAYSGANSLVSTLAFVGVLFTIYLQRNELRLQREEMEQTRGEFKAQNGTLRRQRFEATFFNLLTIHHTITERLMLNVSEGVMNGREAIQHVYRDLVDVYKVERKHLAKLELNNIEDHREAVRRSFSEVYSKYEGTLSHYLRNFGTIIQFVKRSDLIDDSERQLYYDFIKGQVNTYEVCLAFYYFSVGQGASQSRLFDAPTLGSILNASLLLDICHSFLFDPDSIVQMALTADDNFNRHLS